MTVDQARQAPDAELFDTAGASLRLSSLWAEQPLLLIFYPGDETLVCTAQLCEYRDRWQDFRSAGVGLVGINPASSERHQRFAVNHRFPFPILSDPGQRCAKAYGAKAWYGTRRLSVLVGRDGRERWRVATMPFLKPRASTLLAAVQAHAGG